MRARLALLLLPVALVSVGAVRYVPDDAATIQEALDVSEDGDRVIVMPGTYQEELDFQGQSIHLQSFAGPAETILESAGSSRLVLFGSGEGAGAVLDGFTLTGGGVLVTGGSSPVIRANLIEGNHSVLRGGGILVEGGAPFILENRFEACSAEGGGGGICLDGSDAVVRGNRIQDCDGVTQGGGILVIGGAPLVESNLLVDCRAIHGGGMALRGSTATIRFNTLAEGLSDEDGSGIYCESGSQAVIQGNILAYGRIGAGLHVEDAASAVTSRYNDLWFNQGGAYSGHAVEGPGDIQENPLFRSGAEGDYALSQVAAGQDLDSRCLDAAGLTVAEAGLLHHSTRTDGGVDQGVADMGYHRRAPWLVPEEQGTIQAALAAAEPGDRISVGPGEYIGDLDFLGRDAILESRYGPIRTILRGSGTRPVIRLTGHETVRSVIRGFQITGGYGGYGGAILCEAGSATIQGNWLLENDSVYKGSGVALLESRSRIVGNVIRDNRSDWKGAGISVNQSDCLIHSNLILDNVVPFKAGAIWARNSRVLMIGNTLWGNRAEQHGGGIYGVDSHLELTNNVIGGSPAGEGIYLEGASTWAFSHNDVWGNAGGGYGGLCGADPTDLAVDPVFVPGPHGEFYLSQVAAGDGADSPCLDAGEGAAADWELEGSSTRWDLQPDQGPMDIGFHDPDPDRSEPYLEIRAVPAEVEAGDRFGLYRVVGNPPAPSLSADGFVILEAYGFFYFWPDWTKAVEAPPEIYPAGLVAVEPVLDFDWPDGAGSGEVRFWAALFEPDRWTPEGLILLDWCDLTFR